MKRFIPVLISFLMLLTFLLNVNITKVYALNNYIDFVEGQTVKIPISVDNYFLKYENEYLTIDSLITLYFDKTIKLVNNSTTNSYSLYTTKDSSPYTLLVIGVGEEYDLDYSFWKELSETDSNYESIKTRGLYITAGANLSSTENERLEITLLTETSTGTGDTTTEEDDDSGLFENIKEFISGLFEDIPTWIDNAVASIGNFFEQIPTWISNAVDSIGEFFANLITKIGEFVDSAVESIGEFFSNVGQWILDAVDSIGQFFSDITDYIGEFFTGLFEPIVEWFNNKKEEEETKKGFWESFGEKLKELVDKLAGFTLVPIKEFLNNLVNSDVISVLSAIYEFPIIKEMILAVVAVLVVTGLLGLLLTF